MFAHDAEDDIGSTMSTKLDTVLSNNVGLAKLRNISAILSGDVNSVTDGYSADECAAFRYAPLVSAEVERSFSMYKAVLRDNRHSFTFENLRQHIVYCNR